LALTTEAVIERESLASRTASPRSCEVCNGLERFQWRALGGSDFGPRRGRSWILSRAPSLQPKALNTAIVLSTASHARVAMPSHPKRIRLSCVRLGMKIRSFKGRGMNGVKKT